MTFIVACIAANTVLCDYTYLSPLLQGSQIASLPLHLDLGTAFGARACDRIHHYLLASLLLNAPKPSVSPIETLSLPLPLSLTWLLPKNGPVL